MFYNKEIKLKISPQFTSFLSFTKEINLIFGALGSGKTHFLVQFSLLSLIHTPHLLWWASGTCARSLPRSLFLLYQRELKNSGLTPFFRLTSRELLCLSSGSQLRWQSLSALSSPDPRLTHLWIDDAHQLPQSHTDLFSYLPTGCRTFLTFRPPSPSHWLRKTFSLSSSGFFSSQGNRSFPRIKLTKRSHIQIYEVPDQDTLFTNFSYTRSRRDTGGQKAMNKLTGPLENIKAFPRLRREKRNLPLSAFSQIMGGIDFGFTHANVCLLVAVEKETIYVLKELYSVRESPSEWIVSLQGFLKEVGFSSKWALWADSADPGQIKDLQKAGIPVQPVCKTPGSLQRGIQWIQERSICVNPDCFYTWQELDSMRLKSLKEGSMILRTPKGDDVLASLRYALYNFS